MSPSPSTPDSRYPPARGTPGHGAWATPSQLDRIAEINARARRQARGERGRWLAALAAVAGLLVLAYGWQLRRGDAGPPLPAARPAAAALSATTPPTVAAAPVQAAAAPPAVAALVLPAVAAASSSASSAASAPATVDRVRQARARQEAEVRARALQQEQALARGLAQEQERERERREAEQAREAADDATRRGAEAAPVRAASAPEPRREVRELCAASSNIVSELFCRSRECRKPERQGDPTCVRLREIEEAQRLGGQQ